MKKKLFTGSGVAIVTPFTETCIDFEKLALLTEYQVQHQTDAIIVCGTTGESATMTNEEHIATIKCVVDTVKGRIPVIAGTGVNDTRHSILLSQAAEEAGADGLLTVTPYYNKTTQAGLCEHFKCIAENTSLPVVLYNVPGRTGININPETYEKLCKIPNINAVKECNLLQIPETVKRCGDELNIYSGEDGLVTMCLGAGGLGVISVVANIMPEYVHTMVKTFLDGDQKTAWDMQLKVLDLVNALFCEVNPIPVKEAMDILGLDSGRRRLPLVPMAPANRARLEKAMADMGVVKGSIVL
ncbi:MAG: 4-hydroxy-tetrahydrodipicolinate synthase [Ruminococcaceae bacterium]|nr:4-hydroxy-tetrahydrodipicolinate synthase [Oscillospiraceae bacterium]